MHKTSVYLPEALKAQLGDVARRTGRSEAQLVRLAVERLVASEPRTPAPATRRDDPVVEHHRRGPALVGVGVGPGDPGLLTLRALGALRSADRVLAPTTSSAAVGRAEAIVREAAPDVVVERLEFVMAVDGEARSAALARAAERVVSALDAGERVAFITLGDPNVYSTFSSVAERVAALRPRTPITTEPGIMAFQELAAAAGTVVLDGDERLLLVPAHGPCGVEAVAAAAADPRSAVVVYKGGGRLPEVAQVLAAAGRLDGAVVGELLGLPGGRVRPVADVGDQPATYLATVLVPPLRPPDPGTEPAS
jgi:precorrin-2/cobalt-factor-2 C20-methyltransferase